MYELTYEHGITVRFDESVARQNWRDSRIAFFDLEATSADPLEADIIEVAFMVYENFQEVGTYATLIQPQTQTITEESQNLHGISPQDVQGAPPFQDVVDDLERFFNRYNVVGWCAWNGLNYDYPLILQQLQRYTDTDDQGWYYPIFDPIVFERDRRGRPSPNDFKIGGNSLKRAAQRYNVASMEQLMHNDNMDALHRAQQDVEIMVDVVEERHEVMPYNWIDLTRQQVPRYHNQQMQLRNRYGGDARDDQLEMFQD